MTAPRRAAHELFVDSSGFFAAATRRDANFEAARRILERAASDRALLTTTTFVVAEAHALFLSKAGRDAGIRFLRSFEGSAMTVVRPTDEDEAAAREIVYRYDDKDFSLTDAISFAVMDRLRLTIAFTFDRDFERYGFSSASA
jgi:predicted nucleic acid-binding protein